jgi:hypothetical protein
MEFALVLRELARRRRVLAVGVLIAAIAAVLSVYRLDGFALKPRALQYSSASTHVFVDTHSSVLGDVGQSFEPLQSRATVYANFMASPTFLNMVGQRVGLAGDQIYAAGPVDPLVPRVIEEPTAVERNVEITGETTPYRLNFNSDPNLPTIGIYAQAPSTKMSVALASAAVASLEQYVRSVESSDHIAQQSQIVIRQLGQPTGGVVDGGISKAIAGLVFFAVFLLWCVLTLMFVRFRETWRASATLPEENLELENQGTQLALRLPTRRRVAHETAADHRALAVSSEGPAEAAGASSELHPRLRASGS